MKNHIVTKTFEDFNEEYKVIMQLDRCGVTIAKVSYRLRRSSTSRKCVNREGKVSKKMLNSRPRKPRFTR